MPTPSGLVTKQELIDAQLDTAHLGRVVNSKDASGAPISTSTNRTGGVNKTLDALEDEYLEAISNAGESPVGDGVWGVGKTYTAYNQYMVYNGILYKPLVTTTLPYTTVGADPTLPPDSNNVQPYERGSNVFTFASVALATSDCPAAGSLVIVDDYYGGVTPNNSGPLFFKVVVAGTGTHDGGRYIDVPGGVLQLQQNLRTDYNIKYWGAIAGSSDNTIPISNALSYANKISITDGWYLTNEVTTPSTFSILGDGTGGLKLNDNRDNHLIIASNVTRGIIDSINLDQNRANNAGGHGIRLAEASDILLSNLNIIECKGYGIGAQTGTLKNMIFENISIDGVDYDGIDMKNLVDSNENNRMVNISVKNYGTAGSAGSAGIDVRGPVQLDNIYVEQSGTTVGVRFRADASGVTGVGGRRSSLSNLRVKGDNTPTQTAVVMNGQYIYVSNVYAEKVDTGIIDYVGKCKVVNFIVRDATNAGCLIFGESSTYSNIHVTGAPFGMSITGDNNTISNYLSDGNTVGVRFTNTSVDNAVIGGSILGGTVKVQDDGARSVVRDVFNYKTKVNVVSTPLDTSSAGSKTFTVPHTLDRVPGPESVQLTLLFGAGGATFRTGFLRVESINATNVTGRLYVDSAGQPGDTVKVNVNITDY